MVSEIIFIVKMISINIDSDRLYGNLLNYGTGINGEFASVFALTATTQLKISRL